MSVAEAARRLDRSTEQVRRYLREGRLRGTRVGGQWFIEATALGEFVNGRQEERTFIARLSAADQAADPLAAIVGIGGGGGSNIADGKDAYRRAFWWRR